jgi:hypothetical protein
MNKGDRVEEAGTRILRDWHCRPGEGCTYDLATDTAWWFRWLYCGIFLGNVHACTER